MSLEIVSFEAQGPRDHMEDRHVIKQVENGVFGAVFDGHCGEGVAEYAKEHFLDNFLAHTFVAGPEPAFRETFLVTHDRAPRDGSGACAVAFCLYGDLLTVANTGDSHALLVHPAGLSKMTTVDHRLSNVEERDRVVKEYNAYHDGTYIYHPGGGGLMPTRSLGDHRFNDVGIIAEPSVSTHEFPEGYLVVATDGLWDYVSQTAVAACCVGGAEEAGQAIGKLAARTGDNITIIVIRKS